MKCSSSDSNDSDSTERIETPSQKFLRACEKGKLNIVSELIKSDEKLIHTRDKDDYTPLHRASYNNHPQIVKILLEAGASVSCRTIDGWTPLHSACNWNSFECASLLLSEGADINARTNSGQTPLHLAAANRNAKEVLQLLLFNYFVDIKAKNSNGETATQIAQRCGPYSCMFESGDFISDPDLTEGT